MQLGHMGKLAKVLSHMLLDEYAPPVLLFHFVVTIDDCGPVLLVFDPLLLAYPEFGTVTSFFVGLSKKLMSRFCQRLTK